MLENFSDADRPSILSYLQDPSLPSRLIESFFHAAIDYADAFPWSRLMPSSHFPILLDFLMAGCSVRRLAMILGGGESGDEAVGLALIKELPAESLLMAMPYPAVTVLYAGYPDPDVAPLQWRGRPLPRSKSGLLAWPTVHDVDDRVRAPRQEELTLLTCGLFSVRKFLDSYPKRQLDDGDLSPHRLELVVAGLPDSVHVSASTFTIPPG